MLKLCPTLDDFARVSFARSSAILSAFDIGSHKRAELEFTIVARCFINFIYMSFTQNVRIASVPNGTRTISATGSSPNIATPVVMDITSSVIRIQRIVKMKLNNAM